MADTSELIDTLEFESPINLEGSWGQRNLSEKARSKMELYFDKDDTGFIEWTCDELDLAEQIGLWFQFDRHGRRTLTDYDGVFSIPDQALDLLERNGVDVAEMRKSMDTAF